MAGSDTRRTVPDGPGGSSLSDDEEPTEISRGPYNLATDPIEFQSFKSFEEREEVLRNQIVERVLADLLRNENNDAVMQNADTGSSSESSESESDSDADDEATDMEDIVARWNNNPPPIPPIPQSPSDLLWLNPLNAPDPAAAPQPVHSSSPSSPSSDEENRRNSPCPGDDDMDVSIGGSPEADRLWASRPHGNSPGPAVAGAMRASDGYPTSRSTSPDSGSPDGHSAGRPGPAVGPPPNAALAPAGSRSTSSDTSAALNSADDTADTASSSGRFKIPRQTFAQGGASGYAPPARRPASPDAEYDPRVIMVGEKNPEYELSRGDIVIIHPAHGLLGRTIVSQTVERSAVGEPRVITSRNHVKVWSGDADLQEFKFFHGDLVLRLGQHRNVYLQRAETPWVRLEFNPYARVELHAFSLRKPTSRAAWMFLGYQDDLKKAIKDIPDSPSVGKRLREGESTRGALVPRLGDIMIFPGVWIHKFAHRQNFRRSMVKWHRDKHMNFAPGTLLVRPFVDRANWPVNHPQYRILADESYNWGAVEIFNFDGQEWFFWGRANHICDTRSSSPANPPEFIQYAADP